MSFKETDKYLKGMLDDINACNKATAEAAKYAAHAAEIALVAAEQYTKACHDVEAIAGRSSALMSAVTGISKDELKEN